MKSLHLALSVLAAILCVATAHGQSVLVKGSLSRAFVLASGGATQDTISLTNCDAKPAQVKVYQTDYTYSPEGTHYDAAGSAARSNAAWITCTPTILTLAPRQTTEVAVRIQAPQDTRLEGTYWSVIMVEPQGPPPAPLKTAKDKLVLGIQTVMRYGIQVATTIGATGTTDLKFLKRQMTVTGSRRSLELDLENSGTRVARPYIWAEFRSVTGALVTKVKSDPHRLYPGCSAAFKLDLGVVPRGKYEVLAVADNGDDGAFGARYQLEIE
jgi:P pilus assembly chaperone PapD